MRYVDEEAGIYLREINEADTDSVLKWRNSPDIRTHFIIRDEITKDTHLSWLHNKVEKGLVYQTIICDINNDKPLGSVYIQNIDRHHKKGEFGIFIGEKDARGKGIGTAATRLILEIAFKELSLHRVYLRLLSSNERALNSYLKAGFVKEGLLKEDVFVDGKYEDVIWMAVINPLEDKDE
ncbi:MAG: UDP-4-amino-4,6-dideoxy-N-acetyl-beta-L-altrosamine N-acetyltransferase [Lachnospiraceae bacterium]|nr:UDP-4-amino-4,6-dideoxy-N-acetyl-beta-L-altrosamine N-acetyltransferase [Lachnospiraceae bacterium]